MAPWTLSGTTWVSWHQKGKTNLDLLEQEIVNGSGISWAICKSATRPRQVPMPASNQSVFYRPDALPAAQPTASNTEGLLAFKTQEITYTLNIRISFAVRLFPVANDIVCVQKR